MYYVIPSLPEIKLKYVISMIIILVLNDIQLLRKRNLLKNLSYHGKEVRFEIMMTLFPTIT